MLTRTIRNLGCALTLSTIASFSLAATVAEFAIASDGKSREDLWPLITSVILNGHKDDVVTLVNAQNSSRVATIKVTEEIAEAPTVKAKATWLTKQQGEQIQRMKQFLTSTTGQGAAHADFARYVQSLELRKTEFNGYNIQAVFVGSPLSTQPDNYSMRGRYLSDSFISHPETPFSTVGKQAALRSVNVHVLHSPAAMEFSEKNRDLHQTKVRRFVGLFVSGLGGNLATFSGDGSHLKTLLTTQFNRQSYGTPEASDGKLRVYDIVEPRLVREDEKRQISLWDSRIDKNPSPPARGSKSPIDIGITWDKNVDLDVYVKADGDNEIFYGFTSSETYGARFLKDITTLPESRGYETVTFSKDTPLANLKVFINHYAGTSNQPINGELRIRIDDKIYAKTFQFRAGSGTRGRGNRNVDAAWIPMNISTIVGL